MTSTTNQLEKYAKDLSIIVNSGLLNSKDDYDRSFDDAQKWLNDIIIRDPLATINKKVCEICDHCIGLEAHHIAGRKHDDRTMMVCKQCHRVLSDSQKVWGNGWEKGNQPERLRRAFFLLGLRDILYLKSKKTSNSIYEAMADNYTEDISKLLKGD